MKPIRSKESCIQPDKYVKMIRKLILIHWCGIFVVFQLSAAIPDSTAVAALQRQAGKLRTELKNQKTIFLKQLSTANRHFENLQSQLKSQKQIVALLADSLGVRISETARTTRLQIEDVNRSVGKKSLFVIRGGILLLLLSTTLFVWLFKRQKVSRTDIVSQLEKTKSWVEEELVKEFSKQTEVLETLVEVLRATATPLQADTSINPDHSLALKLADEIMLMERNISLMDAGVKGLKQLRRSIGKLKDNLAANGYEIPELLNKPYSDGMKVIIVNSIYDEKLEKGTEIITKIIKPQINYQDKMIQAAQIEVSVG